MTMRNFNMVVDSISCKMTVSPSVIGLNEIWLCFYFLIGETKYKAC